MIKKEKSSGRSSSAKKNTTRKGPSSESFSHMRKVRGNQIRTASSIHSEQRLTTSQATVLPHL